MEKIKILFQKLLSDQLPDKKYKLAFLFILSAAAFFNHIGVSTLGFDDAFYAQKAKEMVEHRDWFYTAPTHGGRLSFDNKPPVLFWMLGAAGAICGFSDGAMRFFPALFALLSVITLFFLASYLTQSQRFGFLSAFILLFTQQFIYYGRSTTPESLYTFLWLTSLWCFKKALDENNKLLYPVGGFLVGVAIMTRNLPAIMIYLTIIVFAFSSGKIKSLLRNPSFYLAILITIIVAAPWHIFMLFLHGKYFAESYFGVIARYGLIARTLWYEYIRKIIENYWPWLPFLLVGLFESIKTLRTTTPPKTGRLNKDILIFIFSVVIPFILIYQLAGFKAVQYLVPLYPFMAMLSSEGLLLLDKNNMPLTRFFVGLGTTLAVLWLIFPILPSTLDSKEFSQFIKLKDTLEKINSPIHTPDQPDLWHFRNGFLFYATTTTHKDSDILPALSTHTATLWLNGKNCPPYYFIIKKKFIPQYFRNSLSDDVIVLAETEESVILTNKAGAEAFYNNSKR